MLIVILVGLSFFSAGTDGQYFFSVGEGRKARQYLRQKTVSKEDKLKARDEPSRDAFEYDPYDYGYGDDKPSNPSAKNRVAEGRKARQYLRQKTVSKEDKLKARDEPSRDAYDYYDDYNYDSKPSNPSATEEPSRDSSYYDSYDYGYRQAKSRKKNRVADAQNGTAEKRRNANTARAAGQSREERNEICQKLKEEWGAVLDSWACCNDVEKGKRNWFGHSIKPETLDLGYPHCLPNGMYAPHQCVDKDPFSLLDLFIGDHGCFCVTEYGKLQPQQSDFDPNCNPYPETAWAQKRIQDNAVKNYLIATIKKEIPAEDASVETNRPN